MAKKSSKANSPSWRTLRRQADEATSAGHRKDLLKLANRLRRQERNKAKLALLKARAPVKTRPTGSKKPTRKAAKAVKAIIKAAPAVLAAREAEQINFAASLPPQQGWTARPVQTVAEMQMADRVKDLRKLARSKSDKSEDIAHLIGCWTRMAQVETCKEVEEYNQRVVQKLIKQNAINVVASFLCASNALAKANGGPMPRSTVISGYVLARVVDALQQAGYTEDGYKSDGIRRLDREDLVDEMVKNRTNR